MRHFVVWENTWSDPARGGKTVKCKWIDREGRSRLVAMEIAYDLRGDCQAGTPPLGVIRYVVSDAATGSLKKVLGIFEVTCAFLHADMSGEEPIWILLPAGLSPPGTKERFLACLYGTRRASFLWGEKVGTVMASGGFTRARAAAASCTCMSRRG